MKQKSSYSKVSNSTRSVTFFGYFLILLFTFQLANQAFPAIKSSSALIQYGIPSVAIEPEFITEQRDEDQPVRPSHTTVLSEATNGIEKDPSPDDLDGLDADLPAQFKLVLDAHENFFVPSRHSVENPSSVSFVILYHCWKTFLH